MKLTCVFATESWKIVIGPDNELIIKAISTVRRTEGEVKQINPDLTNWLFAIMTHSQVTLRSGVCKRSRVVWRTELKLDISSPGSTSHHLCDNTVGQGEAATTVTLVGVKLYLKNVSNGFNLSWRRLATVFVGCSSYSRVA